MTLRPDEGDNSGIQLANSSCDERMNDLSPVVFDHHVGEAQVQADVQRDDVCFTLDEDVPSSGDDCNCSQTQDDENRSTDATDTKIHSFNQCASVNLDPLCIQSDSNQRIEGAARQQDCDSCSSVGSIDTATDLQKLSNELDSPLSDLTKLINNTSQLETDLAILSGELQQLAAAVASSNSNQYELITNCLDVGVNYSNEDGSSSNVDETSDCAAPDILRVGNSCSDETSDDLRSVPSDSLDFETMSSTNYNGQSVQVLQANQDEVIDDYSAPESLRGGNFRSYETPDDQRPLLQTNLPNYPDSGFKEDELEKEVTAINNESLQQILSLNLEEIFDECATSDVLCIGDSSLEETVASQLSPIRTSSSDVFVDSCALEVQNENINATVTQDSNEQFPFLNQNAITGDYDEQDDESEESEDLDWLDIVYYLANVVAVFGIAVECGCWLRLTFLILAGLLFTSTREFISSIFLPYLDEINRSQFQSPNNDNLAHQQLRESSQLQNNRSLCSTNSSTYRTPSPFPVDHRTQPSLQSNTLENCRNRTWPLVHHLLQFLSRLRCRFTGLVHTIKLRLVFAWQLLLLFLISFIPQK